MTGVQTCALPIYLATRSIDLVCTAAIQYDDPTHSPIGYDHVATASEHQVWPSSARCQAHDAAQGEAIFDGDQEVRWATDAHRRVGRERHIALCAQTEATFQFAGRNIAFVPRPRIDRLTHCRSPSAPRAAPSLAPLRAATRRRNMVAMASAASGRAIARAAVAAAPRTAGERKWPSASARRSGVHAA